MTITPQCAAIVALVRLQTAERTLADVHGYAATGELADSAIPECIDAALALVRSAVERCREVAGLPAA